MFWMKQFLKCQGSIFYLNSRYFAFFLLRVTGKSGRRGVGGEGAQSSCLVKESEIANSKSGLRNNLILRGNISSI